MKAHEELQQHWLEKNATSKYDQGHNHYVEPNDDERRYWGSCTECRAEKTAEVESEIDFWDLQYFTEDQVRRAIGWWLAPDKVEDAITELKRIRDTDE